MPGTFAIGMDLGGTNARAAVVDERGRVVSSHRQQLEKNDPESAADALAFCVEQAIARSMLHPSACVGYGAGLAGQLEAGTHRVLVAPSLGWRDVDFAALLAIRLQAPVRITNDLSAAALGETRAGAARGYANAVLVFVGSGIGAGLVLGGRLYEGATGVAGELGHVKVKPGGRKCGCGEAGCLEAYAGGHNLGRRAGDALRAGRESSLEVPEGLNPTAKMLALEAAKGDSLSVELLEEAGRLVGLAAANVMTLLNPDVLVLGGGVLLGAPLVRQGVETTVRAETSRTALSRLVIADTVLGDDAGVIGAAYLAREEAGR